ncbi:uncharacterized protein LOC134541499 [Bacillus rossius redtenbacheri]|uniref:uncharacterized protein LOC134541499 n=1 Tax=Bacillus rossius redtenbacheri TaxID=93214 RepID=UPI002FDDD6DB
MTAALLPVLTALLCGAALAQYDSPTPPRPVIPGAVPAPRPQLRRIQAPLGGRALPQGVLRVRRPPAARPPPPPPPQQDEEEEDFSALRSGPSLPPAFASLPPRPVEERPEEEPEYDALELELNSPAPNTPPPPPPQPPRTAPTPARPQSLQPAVFRPSRPAFRPERPPQARPAPEDLPVPSRQQFRQQGRPRPPAEPQFAPQPQVAPRRPPQQQVARQPAPEQEYIRDKRPRKPVAQVIHKYRDDNPDGSITWGYENDDGTFKEETIGVDCMVRGKYGYVDPDGVKREYSYSSGIPCDKDKERESEGFIDYQNNKYVLANGDTVDLQGSIKNKGRRPAPVNSYRN